MSDTRAIPFKRTSPAMRRMRVVNGLLVLTIGVSLFVFTNDTERYFAWTVQSSLTAATLGAFYLAATLREFLDARQQAWSDSRAAVPGVIVFSLLMLVATLLHLDKFHFNSPVLTAAITAWAWAIVYLAVPIFLAICWLRQERMTGADASPSAPLARWVRTVLFILATTLVLIGIALFLAPQAVAPAWPWTLTPLTARAIASWLAGVGVVMYGAAIENDVRRIYSNLVFLFALGALQFIALARYPSEFAWGTPGAWFYLTWVALSLTVGAYGTLTGYPFINGTTSAKHSQSGHASGGTHASQP